MNGKLPFTLLCVAVLAFACGPRPRNEAATGTRATTGNADAARNNALPLALSFAVDVDRVVRFDFQIINQGKKKLEVTFADGRTHDVVVLDTLGNEVWRWSDGRLFTQAMQNKVLRTSDSLRYAESWNNAPPGRYVAVATLASANFPIEHRVEFTVK